MKKQIILILIILLTSCANKKQVTKSSIENNTIEQIDSISNTETSSNTITETNDSTEVTIEEQIEETISDTLNGQTIQRTIKRKSTIRKAANAKIEQSDESYITHNKHKQIKEKKKEDNKTTNIIKHSKVRIYLSIIMIMILFVFIYKFISSRSQ